MQKMAITEFKAHALKVMAHIAKSKEPVIITKRGQPLVQVVPFVSADKENIPGKLTNRLVFETDIVSELGHEMWDACK
jgi:prevent-host-death family protein